MMSDMPFETADERRVRYLRLALEATRYASRARRLEMREHCLNLVQSWLGLARDSEVKKPR
jgi:hypothetical protein